MKNRQVGKKIFLAFILLLLSIVVIIQLTGSTYLYKALLYNYVGIDDLNIFSTRAIPNGTSQPWPIAGDFNKGKLPDSVRNEMEKLKTVAYLVIKDDSIRYEEYWDGYNEKSISNSFSMAKSFVGLLIGIALDEGKIKSLDEPIGNYLPDFKVGQASSVTIRDLLMMSSGSNWEESYSKLISTTTEAYYGNDLEKLINKVKIVQAPGKKWDYKSGDTQMLAFILEKATGEHLADYMSKKLWSKIGTELPAQWSLDNKDGHEKAYCCLYSSARDFARIGKLMMDSGEWRPFGRQSMTESDSSTRKVGEQIVSKDYVRQVLTPNNLIDVEDTTSRIKIYGYHWWLMNYKQHDIFYMRGLLGQYVFVIPDERMIIVRLGKKRESVQRDHRPIEIDYLIEGALEMYGKK